MIKGLSGFAVEKFGDKVIKWTIGTEAELRLQNSARKAETCGSRLYPFIPVIGSTSKENGKFIYTMPYIYGETAFTTIDYYQKVTYAVRSRFFKESQVAQGFHDICMRELNKIPDSELKFYAESMMKRCVDYYPKGFCHGDFGFANMIVNDKGVHLIDFTESFIASPLMDLATMELSLFSDHTKNWHLRLFEQCSNVWFQYKGHIDVLRMIKVLSFYRNNDSDERRKELDRMFYGKAHRERNLQESMRK